MSEYYCISCTSKVTRRMHAICCDGCGNWQHRVCKTGATTGVSADQYRQMVKGELEMDWRCSQCKTVLTLPHRQSVSPVRQLNTTYTVHRDSEDDIDDIDMEYILSEATIDMDFELTDELRDDFLLDDIKMDGARHLILAKRDQLRYLKQAVRWSIGGTSQFVKQPFCQLSSIHAFVRNMGVVKLLPFVYILMSRTTKADYDMVFRSILTHIPEPQVKWIMMDYDAALWQAMMELFPGQVLKGCVTDWSRRVLRKIHSVGLSNAYRKKGDKYEFLKKVLCLPYLPHEHISKTFQWLNSIAVHQGHSPVIEVMKYVQQTWMEGSIWCPQHWSIYRCSVITNKVEAWHRRVRSRRPYSIFFGYLDLKFDGLVKLLHGETSSVHVQILCLPEHYFSPAQTKLQKALQKSLEELWEDYWKNRITTSGLLKKCPAVSMPRKFSNIRDNDDA